MTPGPTTCTGNPRTAGPSKRVNTLIRDMQRTPFEGIGKPEPLKWGLSGAWSRRIDSANRIIYTVADDRLCILSAKDHY